MTASSNGGLPYSTEVEDLPDNVSRLLGVSIRTAALFHLCYVPGGPHGPDLIRFPINSLGEKTRGHGHLNLESGQYICASCKAWREVYNLDAVVGLAQYSLGLVVVEWPLQVWRLHEVGIKNAVAIFGRKLSSAQEKSLLLGSGMSQKLFLALPPTRERDRLREQLESKAYLRIKHLPVGDIASLPVTNLKALFA